MKLKIWSRHARVRKCVVKIFYFILMLVKFYAHTKINVKYFIFDSKTCDRLQLKPTEQDLMKFVCYQINDS